MEFFNCKVQSPTSMKENSITSVFQTATLKIISVPDATWLTAWVKPGEYLTTGYLNLNFVATPKLTPLHSFYAPKVFTFFFLRLPHAHFASAYTLTIFFSISFWVLSFQPDRYPSIFPTSWTEKMFCLRKCKGSSWRPGNWFIRQRS